MKELIYNVHNGQLSVAGKTVELPYPVVQGLDWEGLIIVRLEPAIGDIYNRNVMALNGAGEIHWEIAQSPHGTEADSPYTSISVTENNELVAGNWNGVDYFVSKDDGEISTKSFNK